MKNILLTLLILFLNVQFVFSNSNEKINGAIIHTNSYIDNSLEEKDALFKAVDCQIDLNSFHLFSHAQAGQLLINNQWLEGNDLLTFIQPLVQDKTHLIIYGCNFAKGKEGRAAVAYLKSALGVSVAASDDITGLDGDWDLEVGANGLEVTVEDYQHNLQLDNPDWGDGVTGCVTDALLYPGIAAVTCAVVEEMDPADRYVIAYMSLNDGLTTVGRDTITNADSVLHHSDWLVSNIGNVFGTAIKQSTAELFVTASSNYGAGFGFVSDSPSILNYGSVGGSNEVANAGHIYRVDPVSGAVSVFATLPQLSTTVEHWDCEDNALEITRNNAGVGLGNIVYDEINDQFFVSNVEDGRIYRISNTGAILDSYDPLIYDAGNPGIDNLEDVPYGLAVEPGSNRLFFGVVDDPGSIPPSFDGNPPGFALEGDPSIYSIDLTSSGGFSGTIDNTILPAGVPNNYVGTDVFHTTIPTSEPGARSYTYHTVYFISDLAFNPDGELMAGVRIGCHGSWHSSYNHWGETNFLTLNTGTNLYGTPMEYDVSVTGDAGIDDGYGGVATYDPENGTCQIYYAISSADIIEEVGPHGIAVWESSLTNNPITPIGIFEYGVLQGGDPKGIGGDVEIFNGCSLSCDITGATEACQGADITLTYTPDCPDNLFTWAITSGDATISGANDETMVTITAGTGNYTVTLFPAESSGTCTYDVTVNPLPTVTLTDPADVCIDGSDLSFTATPAPAIGTTGVFSTTAGSGFTDNTDGTATLDVSTSGAGTYDVTYTYTDTNGCSAAQTVSVTVHALPTVTLTDPADVCVNGSNMNFTATPAPAAGTTGVFSTTAGGGLTDNNDGTATLDVSTAGAGTYDVTYTYTNAGGCSDAQTVSVTVNPLPTVTLTDPTDVCVDGSDLSFTATPAPAIGTTGVFSTTAGSGLTDNNDGTATLDVSTAGAGTYDVTYTYTDANGCSAAQTASVTVNALPTVTLTDPADVCVDGSDLSFTATPAPAVGTTGVFSTTAAGGLTDNNDGTATLDVSTAGAGTYDVTYTYTDVNGCSAAQTVSVTVNVVPTAVLASTEGNCTGSTPNDDATIELTSVMDGVEANYSLGAIYTGPAFGDGTNVNVSGGSGTLTGLMHDTEYTVRVFSVNGCFTDYTITSASIVCIVYSLGSTIFEDGNNNGIQDTGENGIGLVPVELYNGVGTLIDIGPDGIFGTADDNMGIPYFANASGDYFFQDLAAGMYQVQLPATAFGSGQPLEIINISSTPTDTNDNEEDEDDNGSQAGGAGTVIVSPIINLGEADGEPTGLLESGQGGTADEAEDAFGDMTVDFGLFAPVSLGDTTFVDVNENGLQDAGEPELEGVTVTLYNSADGMQVTTDADGNVITGTTMTNAMGFYEFTNLPPGDYYVVFDISSVPGNEFFTFTSTTGGDEANDSDADPTNGQTESTGPIASGERFPDLDAGVVCIVDAEAGTGQTICSTATIDLTSIGASITPDNVAGFGATWTTNGNGTFDDGNAGVFGTATSYTLGAAEIAAGQVTLTLTTDDPMAAPFNSAICGPVSDEVIFIILQVGCGTFPWDGND